MKIFPFAPDYGTQPQLSWAWRMAIATALDQSETRSSLASRSLLKFNFDVGAMTQDEAERMQLWLNNVDSSDTVLMPLWVDRVFLSGAVAAASSAHIPTEDTTTSLFAGATWLSVRPQFVLWHSHKTHEAITINEVDPSYLVPAAATVNAYASGDSVLPGILGYIHLAQKGTLKTDELLRISVKFEEIPKPSSWSLQLPAPTVTNDALIVPPSTALSYQIVTTGSPTVYAAATLPAGLSLNAATGLITGTITSALPTVYTIDISATNGSGTAHGTLTITVKNVLSVVFSHIGGYPNTTLGSAKIAIDGGAPQDIIFGTTYKALTSFYYKVSVTPGSNIRPDVGLQLSLTWTGPNVVIPGSYFNYVVDSSAGSGTGQPNGEMTLSSIPYILPSPPPPYVVSHHEDLSAQTFGQLTGPNPVLALGAAGTGGFIVRSFYGEGFIPLP